jgi:hypothetical protein
MPLRHASVVARLFLTFKPSHRRIVNMDIRALKTELRFTFDKLEQQRQDVVRRLLKWLIAVVAAAFLTTSYGTGKQQSGDEWGLVVTLVFLCTGQKI